jgi:hypothetical protein
LDGARVPPILEGKAHVDLRDGIDEHPVQALAAAIRAIRAARDAEEPTLSRCSKVLSAFKQRA